MTIQVTSHQTRRQLLALSIAATLSGCGVQPMIEAAPSARGAAEGVTVQAEPRVNADQQLATFRTNLRGVGVLPILVVIGNGGTAPLAYRASDIQLLVGQTVIGTETPLVVSSRMQEGSRADVGAAVVGAMISLPVAVVAGLAMHAAERHENREGAAAVRQNRGSLLLEEGEIPAGAEARGYVFFAPPPGVRRFSAGTLRVPVQRVGTDAPVSIDVPVTGLGYIPVSR